ncbi:MAG TPA: hypothetical protein VF557_19615 [Jatrophihabitans sp.]|jgi:hypothetical protein|uniref:hypothetical protein n=1 Tax=Jatrophihabitans sp. TaxID=1932789 RepID=UPI002F14E1B8
MSNADDKATSEVSPIDFLTALLRLTPEDAARVRTATPPPPDPDHDRDEGDD